MISFKKFVLPFSLLCVIFLNNLKFKEILFKIAFLSSLFIYAIYKKMIDSKLCMCVCNIIKLTVT